MARRFLTQALPSTIVFCLISLGFIMAAAAHEPSDKLPAVIAHRGASGYLPEHTREATSMAHALGADFIEQDLVLSRDGIPVVLHDIHLDTVTDVRERFPNRKREDGRWYAIDFTLTELKQLSVIERIDLKSGRPVFPSRYPSPTRPTSFRIATLDEMIELIQGLNRSTGRTAGIYPEVKQPAWHRSEGQDISAIVLEHLSKHGYTAHDSAAILQCFEEVELQRIRVELKSKLRLVQLLGGSDAHDQIATPAGFAKIAAYADGVGPSLSRILTLDDMGSPRVTSFVKEAHAAGLIVHPYTVRRDALPAGFETENALLKLLGKSGVDGYFSDFPHRAKTSAVH